MQARAAAYQDEEIQSFQEQVGKPVVLAVSYASADGATTACLPDPLNESLDGCLDPGLLERPNADIPPIALDLDEQARAYNALLVAMNERDWISGFISRGYYPPAALQDKSPSVHGKPASQTLEYWFPQLVGTNPQ